MKPTDASIDSLVRSALESVGPKPHDADIQANKKNFAQRLSDGVALALAAGLRGRGMDECAPTMSGEQTPRGTERRMAGGIGAKKVDVSWSTDTSGLILAMSIKSINFRDARSGNFQKNLTNRRGDMLYEAVTLHRRFPFAVIAGFLFLDKRAGTDGSPRRNSTLVNAHQHLRLFTGRRDPGNREEQLERLYIVQYDMDDPVALLIHQAGWPDTPSLTFEEAVDDLVEIVAERNADLYEARNGRVRRV